MQKKSFTYQTSEKIKIEYNVAKLSIRLAAFLVDWAILMGAFIVLYFLMIFFLLGGALIIKFTKTLVPIYILMIVYGILGLFFIFYPFIFELMWKGQTPGKRILNIQVVNDDGSYLRFSGVLLRNLFRIVDMLPVSYIFGFITMICNKKRKRIGDYVAGTIVVRKKKVDIPKFTLNKDINYFSGMNNLKNKFSDKEKYLIESYIQSKKGLHSKALDRIEKELIRLIEKKINMKKPGNIHDEDFIISLYQHIE